MQEGVQTNTSCAFTKRLDDCGCLPLRAAGIDILQLNITRRCNMACKHCHVNSGPNRTEEMNRETMDHCIQAASCKEITTIDITGGAPEMHPDLEWFIEKLAGLKKRLIVRSNLLVLLEPDYQHYMDVFAAHKVELVGSLPSYNAEMANRQRGSGFFKQMIQVIRKLNAKSFGMPDSGLSLHLVHNPVGAYLPGSQASLETEYHRVLRNDHNLHFSSLFSIVNSPIGRYLDFLHCSGNLTGYMGTLESAFNPQTINNVMCRTTLSVGWDGHLYDCDFNQMLNLTVNRKVPAHIKDFDFKRLADREIIVHNHCFACTAGAGSSCQGALE